MKILVTGAGGYLGLGVVKKLLDDGVKVIATDFKIDNIDCRAKCLEANLFDIDEPYIYFDKPDILLHMAWRDGFIHNSYAHIDDLPKHVKFIENMISSGVKQVCIMGSMHEVGFYEGCINENTICNPQSMYGISKNALRNIVELLTSKNNTIFQWLRGYYIVGNNINGGSIFSKISRAEIEGKELFPFTTGQNQYDFLEYDEFCMQVAAVIKQKDINGIINICSGIPEKLSDRVERFIKDNNYNIKLNYGVFPDRPYDSKAVWGNNNKIKSIMENQKVQRNADKFYGKEKSIIFR